MVYVTPLPLYPRRNTHWKQGRPHRQSGCCEEDTFFTLPVEPRPLGSQARSQWLYCLRYSEGLSNKPNLNQFDHRGVNAFGYRERLTPTFQKFTGD
jgi:hypothetical protein